MLDQFICYGLGSTFHWVEEVLEKRMGAKIVALIDRRHEQLAADFSCPVWDPDALESLKFHGTKWFDVPVILALGDPASCQSVRDRLHEVGFHKVVSLNEIYEAHLGFQLDDTTCANLQTQLVEDQGVIARSRSLLADALSIKVFNQLLSVYERQQGLWIDAMPTAECYFPSGLKDLFDYSCIVQCGVAADELQLLLKQEDYAIKELICFEPDPMELHGDGLTIGLFDRAYARSEMNLQTRLKINPIAAYSKSTREAFKCTGIDLFQGVRKLPHKTAFASRLCTQGQQLVDTIDLDTALNGHKPTLIAIDAEGSELDIISGASVIIETHRPTLIIAAYHRMNHLWQIIDGLNQRVEEYRFFVRNYTGFAYETFVYAIPAERWGDS